MDIPRREILQIDFTLKMSEGMIDTTNIKEIIKVVNEKHAEMKSQVDVERCAWKSRKRLQSAVYAKQHPPCTNSYLLHYSVNAFNHCVV